MKKVIISAGEASGDYYASKLAIELKKITKEKIKIIGFGGEKMKEAGIDVRINLVKLSIIGFVEVLFKFIQVLITFYKALHIIKNEKPDLLVVVDYPGFHLNLIKHAKKSGIKKIVYYITPQVWAWDYKRIYKIKKYVDLAIVVLPFEKKVFENENIRVKYFGHPIAEYILKNKKKVKKEKNINIGLFPGSRNSEIKKIFPVILKAANLIANKIKNVNFIVFKSHTVDTKYLLKFFSKNSNLKIKVVDSEYKYNYFLDCAIIKSGTISLEVALLGVPGVVVYKTSFISYLIAKKFLKVKYISLPNLILNKMVMKEFIQNELTEQNIFMEINKILTNAKYRNNMKSNFKIIIKQLYKKDTTKNIAKAILKEMSK